MQEPNKIADALIYQLYLDEVLLTLEAMEFWSKIYKLQSYTKLVSLVTEIERINSGFWDTETIEAFMQTPDVPSYLNSLDNETLRSLALETNNILNQLFEEIEI